MRRKGPGFLCGVFTLAALDLKEVSLNFKTVSYCRTPEEQARAELKI
jgi:hypothetical protein